MLVARGNHKAKLQGYKSGEYLVIAVRSENEGKNKLGETLFLANDVFYYHLQYPTRQEVYDHLQFISHHPGWTPISILPHKEISASEDCKMTMPAFGVEKYRQCGYRVAHIMKSLN